MTTVLVWIDAIFDVAFRVLRPLTAFGVLIVFAILTALLSLLIVRGTSDQKAIRRTKDLMSAHVLEVRLFPDQLRVVLRAYLTLFWNTLQYLRYTLVALLILAVPLAILFVQLESYFGNRPVVPGNEFILRAVLAKGESGENAVLALPAGLEQSAPPVHIAPDREIDWRLRAQRAGIFDANVVLAGTRYSKKIVAGEEFTRVTPERDRGGAWLQMIHPGETPISSVATVEHISVQYPAREFRLRSWKLEWLIPYIFLTLLAALLLKGAMRTEL